MAVFEDAEGKKIKTTHFGQRGASDYTKHGDKERMERYLERHGGGFETSTKEDWKDPTTAGSLSRWILWNKPSLSASFADYKKRFGLKGSLSVSKSAEGLEVNNEQKFVLKNPQDYEAMMEEIRPQLEAHKIPWKLWYLERKLDGVGGKTWKRGGVYPVVIIRPNEMELKWPNGFTKYLRKQKGGTYHRVSEGVSGNPYKHLVFKGNHIYGGDEEKGFQGKGVRWFDPKIDKIRIETLWFKETKITKIKTKNGVKEITGNEWSVWRGKPSTPKKKDMRLPPQFKKMMKDVGFTDFKPKMQMGSELYIHPTWRANKVPIGALVKIPHEWGGKYYASEAKVVESRPANKAETKSFIRKNKDKGDSEKSIERAENGELWSLSFNISEWPQELKNKFKDYIVDEDYFIGLNFPETSLQPSKVLYSKEADKYYAAGMEKPYQDNTSFMLSLLGIDFDAESEEKVVGKRMEQQAYHKKPSYELSYRGKTVKAIYHDSYHQNLRGKGFYSFMGIPELEGYDIVVINIGVAKARFKRWVDKYYEKTNRGNTEFMLSLLGIDFDAEWINPPKRPNKWSGWKQVNLKDRVSVNKIFPYPGGIDDKFYDERKIDFEEYHHQWKEELTKDSNTISGIFEDFWIDDEEEGLDEEAKQILEEDDEYQYVKYLESLGYSWIPNLVGVGSSVLKGKASYQDYRFYCIETQYHRWGYKHNAHDWTTVPYATTYSYWVLVAKETDGVLSYVTSLYHNHGYSSGKIWVGIEIEDSTKRRTVPLVNNYIYSVLYKPTVGTDMVEDVLLNQGYYLQPQFAIYRMKSEEGWGNVLFAYDYEKVYFVSHEYSNKKEFGMPLTSEGKNWKPKYDLYKWRRYIDPNTPMLIFYISLFLNTHNQKLNKKELDKMNTDIWSWFSEAKDDDYKTEIQDGAIQRLIKENPKITVSEFTDLWAVSYGGLFDYGGSDNGLEDEMKLKLLFSAETKSPAQKSLDKWTWEDWGTKSGKPSTQGSQATGERYLPRKAREALTDKEYARTSAKKRRDMKQGKQFSQQPDDIEEKTAKYRSEVFEAIEGTGSNARFTDQPDPKIYRDPALRQKARNKLLKGNKGGDEGEWSARKAQMAATEYRKMYENKYGTGKNPYF